MAKLKRPRLGFVGLRNIGMGHVRRALGLDGVSVAALADADAERLDAACSVAGSDVARFSSADELFASDAVDAVVLAVPNYLHAPMTIAAMRAGKDVLVEKPMAMNPAEAREMIDARDETGRVLMVGMNQRFVPFHFTARKLLAEGALGRVTHSHTCWLMDRPGKGLWQRGDWFLTAARSGGGPLIDLGIHRLDLALYLLGRTQVESVTGFTTRGIGSRIGAAHGKRYELEDYGFGLVRFADGSALTLEASYFLSTAGETRETILRGTEGALRLVKEGTLVTWRDDEPVETPLEPDESGASSCVEHFGRVLRGEEALIPTPEQGLLGLEIIDAVYRSADTGRTVEFAGE